MKQLTLVFFVLCSIGLYAQDGKPMSDELGLPKQYNAIKKGVTFYELLEKSIRYKEANRQEEFGYKGISYRGDIICAFAEVVFEPDTKNVVTVIRYYFKNIQLKYKTIEREDVPITTLYFDEKGKCITYNDYLMLNPTVKKESHCFFDYDLPVIIPNKNKVKREALVKIKNDIRKILTDKDSVKDFSDFDSFTLKQLNDFKKINAYLKKELKLDLLKNKEIHFVWMGSNDTIFTLEFLDTNGTFYSIGENNVAKEVGLLIESQKRDFYTSIVYHSNGNVKSIFQKEYKNFNNKLLGLNGEYKPNGTAIKEVNLEQAFQLTEVALRNIVRNSKICPAHMNFVLEYVGRRYNTNYGNLWSINVRCLGDPIHLFINDANGEIYTHGIYEYYTSEEYQTKYGEEDYREVEQRINKKIIIYTKLIGEF